MQIRRLTLLLILAMILFPVSATAQETDGDQTDAVQSEDGALVGSDSQFGFGVQSVQFDGQTWTRLHFFPAFPLGKFRFAFDIELFLDEDGNISQRGWNFSNTDAALDSLARKIYYLQYNDKRNVTGGDDYLYAKVGSLDGVTLANGTIVNSYRNTLNYPVEKNIGLEMTLGNITGLDLGTELFLADFTDFGRGGGVTGARLFFSPLGMTSIPLLQNFEIGASFAADLNQYGGLKDSDGDGYPDKVDRFPNDPDYFRDTDGDGIPDEDDIDADGDGVAEYDELTQTERDAIEAATPGENIVDDSYTPESVFSLAGKNDFYGIAGLDVRQPILPFVSVYTGVAMSVDPEQANDPDPAIGWGLAGPGVFLDFLPILSVDVGYRLRKGEFQFGYFNENYDNQRALVTETGDVVTKDNTLTDRTLNGVFGAVNANLYIINLYASYEFLAPFAGGENSMDLEARAGLNRERLAQVPVVSDYLDGLDAYYVHTGAATLSELFSPSQSALMGAELRVKLGESTTLSYDYQLSFDADGERVGQMSIGTQTSF